MRLSEVRDITKPRPVYHQFFICILCRLYGKKWTDKLMTGILALLQKIEPASDCLKALQSGRSNQPPFWRFVGRLIWIMSALKSLSTTLTASVFECNPTTPIPSYRGSKNYTSCNFPNFSTSKTRFHTIKPTGYCRVTVVKWYNFRDYIWVELW